jgi:hypothetical protein
MVCDVDVQAEVYVLTFGACLSLLSLCTVFAIYFFLHVPHLKRHSSSTSLSLSLSAIATSTHLSLSSMQHLS